MGGWRDSADLRAGGHFADSAARQAVRRGEVKRPPIGRREMNGDLHERRKWFKEYFESTNAMVRRSRPKDFWFTCPVCGYPTHLERRGFDICRLCSWEDDGQGDPEADGVNGGPHGDFSLTEARENFVAYRTKYRPGSAGFERCKAGTSANLEAGILFVISRDI